MAPKTPAPAFGKSGTLTKAPNSGKHPIEARAAEPAPTPAAAAPAPAPASDPVAGARRARRPKALSQFTTRVDPERYADFQDSAAAAGLSVQGAQDRAMELFIAENPA